MKKGIHFFPDVAKFKEYRKQLAKKKEKKNEIQPIVFEPEEEEVRMGRPTVLLADQKKTIQGILRYEGNMRSCYPPLIECQNHLRSFHKIVSAVHTKFLDIFMGFFFG